MIPRVLAALRGFAHAFAKALVRAGQRTFQIYLEPFELFKEVKFLPDASGPAILLTITFAIQTITAAQLVAGIAVVTDGSRELLLDRFYSNIAGYVSIRAVTLFVFWFILYIVFWFIMYILGSKVEGFTVFSATGYILSSQLLVFSVYLISYIVASQAAPMIDLVSRPGAYPQLLALTALLFRLDAASVNTGIPLQYILNSINYFGTVWNILLTLLAFRVVGSLSWRKSILGVVAATAISWTIASIFRAAGML